MRLRAGVAVVLAVAVLAGVAGGCRGRGQRAAQPEGPPAVARGKAPSYDEVAAAYNKRVVPLEKLWTRTVARIWFPGDGGAERVEQLEGTLQYIRPERVLVTFAKLNEIYAILGSNDRRYWWIELGDKKQAHVGEHAKATPERVREMGLPVHPLDFVELAGISPLPEGQSGSGAGMRPEVQWSRDGRSLVVTLQGHGGVGGRRRLYLDPGSYEPSRIEILDAAGNPVVYSDLQKYEPVSIGGGFAQGSRVASEVFISMDSDRTRARLRLTSMESGGSRPKPEIFDLERILSGRNVKDVILLDEQPAAAAPEGDAGAGEAAAARGGGN